MNEHLSGIEQKLLDIKLSLRTVKAQEVLELATIDELVAKVEEQTTVVAGVETFIADLKAQLANLGVPQEKIDAAFAGVESNTGRLSAAITANTTP